MRIGGARLSLNEEEPCGDGFAWWEDGSSLTICLVDGLGHGPDAAFAADMALAVAEACGAMQPGDMLRAVDGAIGRSRGVAMSIVRIDAARGVLHHAGIGNTRAALVSEGVSRFEARPGIVGGGCRTIASEEVPWTDGDLLVLWTDGIPAQLDLSRDLCPPGEDPAAMAERLLAEKRSGRDDAAVVCCRLALEGPLP